MAYDPFAPAPAGWYAREGDPPSVMRWWDGDRWTHEVRGALPRDPRPVQVLVDGHEWDRAPFVRSSVPAPTRWSRPVKETRPARVRTGPSRRTIVVRVAIVVAIVAAGVFAYYGNYLTGHQGGDQLPLNSCVTLSAPPLASRHGRIAWTPSDCQTASNGPVSFTVTQKLPGDSSCGDKETISIYLTDQFGNKTIVQDTYCLMENYTVGECVYRDNSFSFDIPCTDARASIKVTKRVEQGSGVTCSQDEVPLVFNPPGRTYCLAHP